jgi:hypothetical protein
MSSLGRVSRSRRAASSSASAALPVTTTTRETTTTKTDAATNEKRKASEEEESQLPPPPTSTPTSTTTKASQPSKSSLGPGSSSKKKKAVLLPHAKLATLSNVVRDRLNPALRGIHPDAIQVGIAPTSASTCVDCGRPIHKGEVRWGIKYGGNPLPVPVVPLYGHMPMIMWCHGPSSTPAAKGGFCGLAYVRIQDQHSDPTSEAWICDASRTCHICSDSPDDTSSNNNLRVLCGGSIGERGKIREHAFHIQCWKSCLIKGSQSFNPEQRQLLESAVNHPERPKQWKRHSKSSAVFGKVLTFQDLTHEEKAAVRRELDL